MVENIGGLAREIAALEPHTEATILEGDVWTYAQLAARVDDLARALIAAGVMKGDRVATLQNPHPEYIVSFLAAASVGAIWVGLNPKYRTEELRHVVNDSEPRVLLARTRVEDRDYRQELAELIAGQPSIETVVVFDGDTLFAGAQSMSAFLETGREITDGALAARRAASGGADPCLIVYTSGSTGRPKGALLHHQGILDFAREQEVLWETHPHSVVNYFPINHIGCVIDVTIPCIVARGTMIFMEEFDPVRCLDLMERHKVTLWGSVPSVFKLQFETPGFAERDLSSVKLIVWEGAAMPLEILQRLRGFCGRLVTNYGMTETGSGITVTTPTDDLEILAESVGHPFPGVEIRLVGEDGQDVADGEVGEVWARSRYNMLGYWRQPEATKEAFSEDGYFKTGDLASRRADGRYRIAGRSKEMYKSGGYNVYPREVEMALEEHPAVGLAAVVGVPDPLWQEVGVAFVATTGAVTAKELAAWCRGRLANYKAPKRYVISENLPLLPIGKVDKTLLKRRAIEMA